MIHLPNSASVRALPVALLLAALLPVAADPVSVREDEGSFTLSNGILEARVLKANGDLRSLKYRGTELFTDRSGHAGGYWSHDTTGGKSVEARVTIDPSRNAGARAEVSVRGISGGIPMGHGPGTGPEGDIPVDIEIRYALERGASGIHTYCVFDHLPEYGAGRMSEARFAAKLADFFDWISVDERRNRHYPAVLPGEDKYVYTALQFDNRAFGFASTTRGLGLYFVNPTTEFLSGGPTKPEFLCHRDTTRTQAPVVLNYWRSSHYRGAEVVVAAGERWTKVVGPFLLEVIEGGDPTEMWRQARARADEEAAKWPYAWVDAGNYSGPAERGSVTGRLVLDDPVLDRFPGRVLVGLAPPAHEVPNGRGGTTTITWQRDAKHYQFWTRCPDPDGRFTIENVSPGRHTLYALADGVLGEFSRADVVVGEGEAVELGALTWKPVRRGRQVWQVGEPNRSALEFAGGDRFFEPGIVLEYPERFPGDVDFTIGESAEAEDWFFAHVPHDTEGEARVAPYRGIRGNGRATPYTLRFQMPEAPSGTATLRLAICGTGARAVDVGVNGRPAGTVALGPPDGVIARHQVQGLWYERELAFPGDLLGKGDNTLTLTVPGGPINHGVVYDCLRLELDETAAASDEPRPVRGAGP